MFDSLDAPADLGAARARLRAVADRLAGSAPVHHLVPVPDARCGPWPALGTVDWSEAGVIVADTILWRTASADLTALAEALGEERSLLFLEPTADVGWRRGLHRVGRPLWRRSFGHDFEADVPARLRAAGLEVVDLRRFPVGRAGFRSYVLGRALRWPEPAPPDPISSG